MDPSVWLNLSAVAAMAPAAVAPIARPEQRGAAYWWLLALAVAGPAAAAIAYFSAAWRTGVAGSLWLSMAATACVFAAACAADRQAWRLAPVLLPYLMVLGLLATIVQHAPARPMPAVATPAWLDLHIGLSVIGFGMLTVAAAAGLAVMLRERAMRRKTPDIWTRTLPAILDSERIEVRLLAGALAVLVLGLLAGLAVNAVQGQAWLRVDHKTVFSLLTVIAVSGVVLAHARTGLRGRRAARVVILANVLLTLGYPGVKFVTDVVMR